MISFSASSLLLTLCLTALVEASGDDELGETLEELLASGVSPSERNLLLRLTSEEHRKCTAEYFMGFNQFIRRYSSRRKLFDSLNQSKIEQFNSCRAILVNGIEELTDNELLELNRLKQDILKIGEPVAKFYIAIPEENAIKGVLSFMDPNGDLLNGSIGRDDYERLFVNSVEGLCKSVSGKLGPWMKIFNYTKSDSQLLDEVESDIFMMEWMTYSEICREIMLYTDDMVDVTYRTLIEGSGN